MSSICQFCTFKCWKYVSICTFSCWKYVSIVRFSACKNISKCTFYRTTFYTKYIQIIMRSRCYISQFGLFPCHSDKNSELHDADSEFWLFFFLWIMSLHLAIQFFAKNLISTFYLTIQILFFFIAILSLYLVLRKIVWRKKIWIVGQTLQKKL